MPNDTAEADEKSLQSILDHLTTVITNTHYWEKQRTLEHPEKVVLDDDAVKHFLYLHEKVIYRNIGWFLCETFFADKPMAFTAILNHFATRLNDSDRNNIIPFVTANHSKQNEELRSKGISLTDVMVTSGIIGRALSQVVAA